MGKTRNRKVSGRQTFPSVHVQRTLYRYSNGKTKQKNNFQKCFKQSVNWPFKINAILHDNRQLHYIKKLFKIKKIPDTDARFSCFFMNRTQPWSLIKRLKQFFIWLQYCRNKRIRKKRRKTLESKWQTCNFGSLTFVDKHVLYALTIWKRLLF